MFVSMLCIVCHYSLGIQAAKTVTTSKLSEFLTWFLGNSFGGSISPAAEVAPSLLVRYKVQPFGQFLHEEDVLLYLVRSISFVQCFEGGDNIFLLLLSYGRSAFVGSQIYSARGM